MKHLLTQIFAGLGVIFLMIILAGIYFFITDPYNLKPMIFGNSGSFTPTMTNDGTNQTGTNVEGGSTTGGFTLSEVQKQALVSFGIDPATVSNSVSTEQEACFSGVLGAPRVAEIKAGAVPSAFEFMKAKACI